MIEEVIHIETYYLIDYENVHVDGLEGCQNLEKSDHIVIFYTKNAKNIDLRVISNHGDAELETVEVPVGNQSADMHIVSYLGYLLGTKGKSCKVVIVSKDTDFDNIIEFWKKKRGVTVSRMKQIEKKKSKKSVKSTTPKSAGSNPVKVTGSQKSKLNQDVMQAVRKAGYNADVANKVAQISVGVYGNERMLNEVHNELRQRYTNYMDVYEVVKPILLKYSKYVQTNNNKMIIDSQNKTATNVEIQRILSKAGYTNDIVNYVASTVVKNLGNKNYKQQIYRSIISKYGQSCGLEVYGHIKKYI